MRKHTLQAIVLPSVLITYVYLNLPVAQTEISFVRGLSLNYYPQREIWTGTLD